MRPREPQALHLMLYDGECGFCQAAVRFVLARDRRRRFRFAALQSAVAAAELAPLGVRAVDLTTIHVIEDHRGGAPVLHRRAGAVLVVAKALGWPWSLLGILRIVPRRWLDAAYDRVARDRHRILGRTEACLVPRPEDRERFLDA